MNKRVQWRAVMLVTMATVAFGLSVRSYAATGPSDDRAPTVERYNPFVSGNRVVFTQVERRNGGTQASVWSRDLLTGKESLVADVQTGEPLPVGNDSWTVWSEVGSGQLGASSVVRARSTARGSRVIDVFSTEYNGPFQADPATTSLSLGLDGNRLVTTNGLHTPAAEKQLVRFTLPSTRPTFVDVTTTGFDSSGAGVSLPGVAQSGATSVYTGVESTLLSVVDGAGNVVAAPAEIPLVFDLADTQGSCIAVDRGAEPAVDGDRIAIPAVCFILEARQYVASIATCVLPCNEVQAVALPEEARFFEQPPTIALKGTTAYLASNPINSAIGTSSTIWAVDVTNAQPARMLRRTSGVIGPRVSVSGNRLVWDETITRDGALASDIYLMDLTTNAVTALRPNGRDLAVPGALPVRLRPDVSNGVVVYNELAADGSSAAIWQRSLNRGRSQLVSTFATETSAPAIGTGWIGWNTRDPDNPYERVVAARGPGQPLLDVYNTDLTPLFGFPDAGPHPVQVDVGGNRVALTGYSVSDVFGFRSLLPTVFSSTLPDGPLDRYTTDGAPPVAPVRTNGRYTSTVRQVDFFPRATLFDAAGEATVVPGPLDASGNECVSVLTDLTTTTLTTFGSCGFQASFLASCPLPCDGGFSTVRFLDGDSFAPFRNVTSMAANTKQAVLVRATREFAGRYNTRSLPVTDLVVVDLAGAAPPVTIARESGVVSDVHVDGDTAVWGTDGFDGGRRGVVAVADLKRNRTDRF